MIAIYKCLKRTDTTAGSDNRRDNDDDDDDDARCFNGLSVDTCRRLAFEDLSKHGDDDDNAHEERDEDRWRQNAPHRPQTFDDAAHKHTNART